MINYMSNGKVMIYLSLFNSWIDKKDLIKLNSTE